MSRCTKIVIYILLLSPFTCYSQLFWDFEAGWPEEWVANVTGRWTVDAGSPLSGSLSLHHIYDNPSNGTDMAGFRINGIRPDLGPAEWSFIIRYGCDPSSSNNWSWFILSDKPPPEMDPGSGVSGYAVGVNLTGYDDILKLYKVTRGDIQEIINTGINWQNDVGVSRVCRIKVKRSTPGEWELVIADNTGNDSILFQGFDDQLFIGGWSGILYRYTSTRDRLVWIDDVTVDALFMEDTIPPVFSDYNMVSPETLELIYDEDIASASLSLSDYRFRGGGQPICESILVSANSIILSFSGPLINKQTSLLDIGFICDHYGNCSTAGSVVITPLWAEEGDLIFSEIMYKPGPVVGLPDAEYLEIYNRTDFDINLKGWKLTTETGSYSIPEAYSPSHGYIVLLKESESALFKDICPVFGLPSFPALTDEGREINLISDFNIPVHGILYNPSWHNLVLKQEGGWSIEMIDTGYPFFYSGNWTSSSSLKGGTPGKVNSVSAPNRDVTPPFIENLFPGKPDELILTFSEPVIDDELAANLRIPGLGIDMIKREDYFGSTISISLSETIKEGMIYTLFADGVSDRAGNFLDSPPVPFGIPSPASPGDILFNELLFDPFPGGYDFVELVNVSDKILNASELVVAGSNPVTSDTSSVSLLSETGRLIVPGGYYVVTRYIENLTGLYPSHERANIHEVTKMPSMPDDKGTLTLYRRDLTLLDRVNYYQKHAQ